jgi:competence protein ComEA
LVLGLLFLSTLAQAEAVSAPPRIDLNRATVEELAELPGIGVAKAAAIVEYRASSGAFASFEDLEAVRGIGPALVAKLRPLVTLGSDGGSKGQARGATEK